MTPACRSSRGRWHERQSRDHRTALPLRRTGRLRRLRRRGTASGPRQLRRRQHAVGVGRGEHRRPLRHDDPALPRYGTPKTRHLVLNAIVEVDGDTAASRSTFLVVQATDTVPFQPIVAGRYYDRFARDADGWYFTERKADVEMVGERVRPPADRPPPVRPAVSVCDPVQQISHGHQISDGLGRTRVLPTSQRLSVGGPAVVARRRARRPVCPRSVAAGAGTPDQPTANLPRAALEC